MAGAAAISGVLLLVLEKVNTVKMGRSSISGSNLPMVTLGMFILWMGWFGFNVL